MKYLDPGVTNVFHPNKYICPAVFGGVHYNCDNRMGPCCLNTITPSTTIEEYLKIPTLVQLKEDMLNGIRNPICNKCYNLEDVGVSSHREDWLRLTTPEVFENNKFFHLELRFSNLCNLRCRTCYATTSSRVATEEAQYFGSDKRILSFSGPDENFALAEAKKIAKDLQMITFSGGEPFMHWQHWEFLDYLIENKCNPSLLYYSNNTLLTFKDQHIFDKWKHFDSILYRASIDAVGEAAEYWRSGTEWKDVVNNITQIKEVMPKVTLEFTITVSWPMIYQIHKIYEQLLQFTDIPRESINFNTAFSRWFDLQVLPKEEKEKVSEYLLSLANDEMYDVSTQKNLLALHSYINDKDQSETMPLAIKKLKEVDIVRNESFIDVFPEWKEMALKYGY
jgi:sulfatase maturation enzyme AslB (radical SAM superfamily)